ncbi:uncharacterized protein DUF1631 [Sphaerotilus hippei]|uniref:Uncharacterized protein DUF1631 n=1 Tax=Sphaerotilus hippei TaxID=744406 RepID=A0A318H057_9BURK|nr:DUF1631 family protein [Sphaerotilus hippei]PXW95904.1 uncharacterized protein DUF1631 [Sphaerotilus hippei]
MAPAAPPSALSVQVRRHYLELLQRELPRVVKAVAQGARDMLGRTTSADQLVRVRDAGLDVPRLASAWHHACKNGLHQTALKQGSRPAVPATPTGRTSQVPLSLVEDDTIEIEIVASRLALAVMDKVSWEFSDLRYRMAVVDQHDEMQPQDLLRPHVLTRVVVDGWRAAGLTLSHWQTCQPLLHEEFAALAHEAYHEVNRWLVSHGVCTEVDLRPFIRRTRDVGVATSSSANTLSGGGGQGGGQGGGAGGPDGGEGSGFGRASRPSGQGGGADLFAPTVMTESADRRPSGAPQRRDVHEETRLMTRFPSLVMRSVEHAEAVLGRLNRLVSRQVPEFAGSTVAQPHSASPSLKAAINDAQVALQRRFLGSKADVPQLSPQAAISTPGLLQELQARKQALKKAASTPVERATIEIVALMFQSLLTEERLPATVRVWFARLQMPVLRVAIVEPDFFATIDHPARRLIDRMGACVMGFEAGSSGVSEPMEKEIKRVVQVVEAYPDTGRRVFQTVLTEFERFVENYFKTSHAAAAKGVSLAQQIEQRETLAIQYTIELRKMLNEVPVHDGVREFLFQIWADVLATTGVKSGPASESTRQMQRAAADLVWLASAKVSREERAAAIRRLPPLLKMLREGMASAGVPQARQDEHIRSLNNSLAAAFSARTATIPSERMDELTAQLETLEDLLPDIGDIEIDESMIRDLSGQESTDLEVVSDGGSMPTPAMQAWAAELQVGSWFKLDYRGRSDAVQLAWQGMRKQLSLFVTTQGRGVMFQKNRLASFLQAGLLLPVEEESLTVRATRDALAKLDADPERLLH